MAGDLLSKILPILALLAFALVIYSGFSKQKIKDVIQQLMEKIRSLNG